MSQPITIRGHDETRKALQDIGRQAPFALSLALNATANEAQAEIKASRNARFTLRRKTFVENTIFRKRGEDFATKTKLQATIRTHPERDFLAQHEEGGQKTAVTGTNLAIPLEAVKPNASSIVPKRLRPSAMRMNSQVRKVVTPSGTFLVRNRPGKGRRRMVGWRSEFLYKLKSSVPIRPRLQMRDTAQKAIDESFVRHAMACIDRALGTAR